MRSADEAFLSQRDIIVIGASARGIETLQALISGLPADLEAAVLVVVHIPPFRTSNLPRILNRSCNNCLSVLHPQDGERIEHKHIYIAPPDYHMLVEDDHVQLWRGPKENRLRPAIKVLFRSAAVAYRERVIGVVLSGTLDDGSTGLWWVKRFGGTAVVQDPKEALFADMPTHALEHVKADHVLPSSKIASLLANLVNGRSAVPYEES